ncbi:MAG: hypothetical protein DMG72_18035 [Acidobacteria bacterium]|nr:MAG: hypothetical protein DMG72_18035 [Acidobacteriota bacterium]
MLNPHKCWFSILLLSVVAVPFASADSISLGNAYALQNNGFTQVELSSHPGIPLFPSFDAPPFQTSLTIGVPLTGVVPDGASDTLVITSLILGNTLTQQFSILAGTYPPPGSTSFAVLFTFQYPSGIFHPTRVNLDISILDGSSQTLSSSASYVFTFVEPAPEPTTLVLLGTGLAGTLAAKMKRRR